MLGWLKRRETIRSELASLRERVTALEADRPRYQLSMENMVAQVEEFLERAEAKRGRAAAALSKIAKREAAEEQQELTPVPAVPAVPDWARAQLARRAR